MTRRVKAAPSLAATLLVLLAGCGGGGQAVPSITLSGEPDSQRSLAPGEVDAARRAAGIQDCPSSRLDATARPGGLPALVLDCLGGTRQVNLAGLPTGRPRVVNLWAQWCGPCTVESPFLGKVAAELSGRVDFLGIDYQDAAAGKAVDFAQRTGMTYPHLVDVRSRSRVPLRVAGVPQTLFVDADGRVVHRGTEPYASAEQLRADIEKYLGVEA